MNEWILMDQQHDRSPHPIIVWGTREYKEVKISTLNFQPPSTHLMPGRKPKPKPKPKPLGPTKATRVAEELIKEVEDWPLVVRLLAAHYQLPELSSKKGLKESYRKIDTISATLK